MKKNTKKLLLFGLTSALLMTGCSKGKEIVQIDGKQYIKEGNNFTQMQSSTKTFLPGEHVIYYVMSYSEKLQTSKEGWGIIDLQIPEVPEGYKYESSFSIDLGGYGYTSNIVHVFVNEVTVEATCTYNNKTQEFGFFEPGTPVKELKLE